MRRYSLGANWVLGLWYAPDGRTLLVHTGNIVRSESLLWLDPVAGRPTHTLDLSEYGPRIAVSADRTALLTSAYLGDRHVVAWRELPTGRERLALDDVTTTVRDLTVSPAGRLAAIARGGAIGSGTTVLLWAFPSGALRPILAGIDSHHLAFAPDGSRLLVVDGGQAGARLFDVTTGRQTPFNLVGWNRTGTFAPDGATLALAGGKTVHLRDAATPNEDRFRLVGHERDVTALAFAPDGRFLATAGKDRTVRVWDAHTGELVRCFGWDVGRVKALAYSPDGLTIAAGGFDGRLVIWDAED